MPRQKHEARRVAAHHTRGRVCSPADDMQGEVFRESGNVIAIGSAA